MSAQVAQSLMNRGLSKPSLYILRIPYSENSAFFNANDYLKYYCKSVNLPEITHDVILSNGHFRQGVVTQQATGFKYTKPLSITMIERSDYFSYEEFHQWMLRTGKNVNAETGAQRLTYKNRSANKGYQVEGDGYCCDIELIKLELPTRDSDGTPVNLGKGNVENMEENFRKVWTAKFVNAFVTSLGSITYSSDARDAMVEYNVEFYFDSFTMDFTNETRAYEVREGNLRSPIVDNINPWDLKGENQY